jgi:predicted 3-demethylubiquinone-9 3-methyltransferase (glyoxalase superfamily)
MQRITPFLWARLTEGGEEVQCGWLTDKYGLSWQIVPSGLNDLLGGPHHRAGNMCPLG